MTSGPEGALDTLGWRAAETVQRLGAGPRRRLSKLRRRVKLAWRRHRGGAEPEIDERLRVALEGGAFTVASRLAEEILGRPDSLADRERRRGLPLALETLLAHGEHERAASIARTHRRDLERSARGASVLALVAELDRAPRLVLPDGRLDALSAVRLIAEGRLDADGVLALLVGHRRALLRNPDLHLLVHDAARESHPRRAVAALGRFLRAHGLPTCESSGASGLLLRDLSFRPSPAVRGPLVSVLVAAHDSERTIEYAVDSILGQSWRDLEVLVCDDASTDGTRALLRRRYGAEPRVRIFESTRNQGPYNVRNHLVTKARGELLAFHDADDLALPIRIEAQVRAMRRGAVACYASWVRVTTEGRFVFFRDQRAVRLCRASLLLSRRTFEGAGPFRSARFGADLELEKSLRMRHADSRIAVLRQPLVFGLWSAASATRRAGSESREDGYRSPARRAYAELLFERFARSNPALTDAVFERTLRETGNWIAPASIAIG